MMHNGRRSKEARRARKQKYRLRQTTSHYSLLVAVQDDVSRKLNQSFLLADSFDSNFVDEERSDVKYLLFILLPIYRLPIFTYDMKCYVLYFL